MRYYKAKKGSAAKETALKWLSKYIRLRDALKTTGTDHSAKCVTCDYVYPIKEMDAGHALSGRNNSILFDETIIYAQCRTCNRVGGGQYEAFRIYLERKHSPEWYQLKLEQRKCNVFFTDDDYRRIGNEYKEKYKKLQERSGMAIKSHHRKKQIE